MSTHISIVTEVFRALSFHQSTSPAITMGFWGRSACISQYQTIQIMPHHIAQHHKLSFLLLKQIY